MKTVGIIGLGLIGGSMAKAVKANTSCVVLGCDLDEETMSLARMTGAIDGPLTDDLIPRCDLIMIAIAPESIRRWAREKAELLRGTVVVDLCGVKRSISECLSKLAKEHGFSYVGGHPMAGKDVAGFIHSTPSLFSGAAMILMKDGQPEIGLLDELKSFFLSLGFGSITFSTAEEHDRIIAYTSQLAHIVSSAYVKSPSAQRQMGFSAGSFRDMTRVARLDENLWTQLMFENEDNLCMELRSLIGELSLYLSALETGDRDELTALLKKGRELKATAGGV